MENSYDDTWCKHGNSCFKYSSPALKPTRHFQGQDARVTAKLVAGDAGELTNITALHFPQLQCVLVIIGHAQFKQARSVRQYNSTSANKMTWTFLIAYNRYRHTSRYECNPTAKTSSR